MAIEGHLYTILSLERVLWAFKLCHIFVIWKYIFVTLSFWISWYKNNINFRVYSIWLKIEILGLSTCILNFNILRLNESIASLRALRTRPKKVKIKTHIFLLESQHSLKPARVLSPDGSRIWGFDGLTTVADGAVGPRQGIWRVSIALLWRELIL